MLTAYKTALIGDVAAPCSLQSAIAEKSVRAEGIGCVAATVFGALISSPYAIIYREPGQAGNRAAISGFYDVP